MSRPLKILRVAKYSEYVPRYIWGNEFTYGDQFLYQRGYCAVERGPFRAARLAIGDFSSTCLCKLPYIMHKERCTARENGVVFPLFVFPSEIS